MEKELNAEEQFFHFVHLLTHPSENPICMCCNVNTVADEDLDELEDYELPTCGECKN